MERWLLFVVIFPFALAWVLISFLYFGTKTAFYLPTNLLAMIDNELNQPE